MENNHVAVSTMSATYYLVALKTGAIIHSLTSPFSKASLDLIRFPDPSKRNLLCGVETEAYILLDLTVPSLRLLERATALGNQSPWYTGAFFMDFAETKNGGSACMIVAEEKKRAIRSFVVNGL